MCAGLFEWPTIVPTISPTIFLYVTKSGVVNRYLFVYVCGFKVNILPSFSLCDVLVCSSSFDTLVCLSAGSPSNQW